MAEQCGKEHSDVSKVQDGTHVLGYVSECAYYLQTVSNLVQYSSKTTWASLNSSVFSIEQTKDKTAEESSAPTSKERVSQEGTGSTPQPYLVQTCISILEDDRVSQAVGSHEKLISLHRNSVQLLQQLLRISSIPMLNGLELETSLIKILSSAIETSDVLLQRSLMDALLLVLKTRAPSEARLHNSQPRNVSQTSLTMEKHDKESLTTEPRPTSKSFLECLLHGLSSPKSRPVLDQWVKFLIDTLLLYNGNAFQSLIPVVEVFRKTIDEVFQTLKSIFENTDTKALGAMEPLSTLNILLNGLEQTLAMGHDQLMREEASAAVARTPDQAQGFFGNMVSGVFASEGQKSRPATANDRLTVLICFKDTVSIAFRMWSWGDTVSTKTLQNTASSASFNYSSIRLRNRTRRLLEHLFTAEPLECLETLIEVWRRADQEGAATIFNLLHALEASRPQNTIPATFNAIYSRTNQSALDPRRSSTLTSELSDTELATFLVTYTRSIDDDALDEIWTDCMAFARDVLGNPMPQRQILPRLLEFVAILGKKIDNTNFGEQRRMRKEIGVSHDLLESRVLALMVAGSFCQASSGHFYNQTIIISYRSPSVSEK